MIKNFIILILAMGIFVVSDQVYAQQETYTEQTYNMITSVVTSGSTIYATGGKYDDDANTLASGLYISSNMGQSWTKKSAAMLGGTWVTAVAVSGPLIYAITDNGFSISRNSGASFSNNPNLCNTTLFASPGTSIVYSDHYDCNTGNPLGLLIYSNGNLISQRNKANSGLGSNSVWSIHAVGSTIYVGTDLGISVSHDGGLSFTNKIVDMASGVNGIAVQGSNIYLTTYDYLYVSRNGGSTFNHEITPSTPYGDLVSVCAVGSDIYLGTSYYTLLASYNSGSSFGLLHSFPNDSVSSLAVLGSTILAGNSITGLHKSVDGGKTFSTILLPY